MPTQTFEQWQENKTRMAVKGSPFENEWNLQENGAVEIICYNWDGNTGCDGYIEVHNYYSLDPTDNTMNNFKAYYLMLDRDEWISWDLSELEHRLYDWIASEGFLDTPEEQRESNIEIDVHNISLEMGAYLAHKYNPQSGDEEPYETIQLEAALKAYLRSWMTLNNISRGTYDGPKRDEYARKWMQKQREKAHE